MLFCVVFLLAAVPGLAQQAEKPGAPAPAPQAAPPGAPAPDQAKEQEAFDIGVEAYIYGYPLVTVEMTRRVMTNVAKPEGNRAPWASSPTAGQYPTAAFRDVTAPNADTLYSVRLAGPRQGALRPEPPGRKGPLLPDADALRLDRRLPGSGQAHHRHQGPEVRNHRPGLAGYSCPRA